MEDSNLGILEIQSRASLRISSNTYRHAVSQPIPVPKYQDFYFVSQQYLSSTFFYFKHNFQYFSIMGSSCSLLQSNPTDQEIRTSANKKKIQQPLGKDKAQSASQQSSLVVSNFQTRISPFSQSKKVNIGPIKKQKGLNTSMKKQVSFSSPQSRSISKICQEIRRDEPSQKKKSKVFNLDKNKNFLKDNVFMRDEKIHEADLREIQNIMMKHFIFSHFSQKERLSFIQQMKYCIGEEGTYIFKKGDESISFYVVLEGTCQTERDGIKRKIDKGSYFGDLGLLQKYPRSASILVKQACLLAYLDKQTFQKAIKVLSLRDEEQNFAIISTIPFFSQFSKSEKNYLAAKSYQINYKEGEAIFRNGEKAINLYILKEGICSDKSETVFYKPFEVIDKGVIFEGIPERTYTLIAKSNCSLLSISKLDITSLMTRAIMSDLIKKEIENILDENKINTQFPQCNWVKSLKTMSLLRFKQNELVFSERTRLASNTLYIIMNSSLATLDGNNCFPDKTIISQPSSKSNLFLGSYYGTNSGIYAVIKLNHDNSLKKEPKIINLNRKSTDAQFQSASKLLYLKNLYYGSHCRICCCYEPDIEKKFALKIQMKQKQEFASAKKLMRQNQIVLRLISLQSPFLARYFKIQKDEKKTQIIQEMIEGQTLTNLLQYFYPSKDQICLIMSQLILALQTLHKHEILYRNLKKENLMIGRDGYIKLIDLQKSQIICEYNKFRTSTIICSPQYMTPQMILGKGYGFQVDYWHLGLLFYELTCEFFPFENDKEDPMVIYQQILSQELFLPSSLELGCKQLLKRLLSKSKFERLGGGFEGLKQFLYFKKVNWQKLERKEVRQSIRAQINEQTTLQQIKQCVDKNIQFSKFIENNTIYPTGIDD